MKKLLVASTALVLVAGAAVAEVKVSGNGRMGVVHNTYKVNGNSVNGADGWDFNSRFRVVFTASGETDGGLSFGGTIRADNAPAGASGTAGNIWISGAFGKLSMGDVDSAAEAAVGNPLRTFPGFVDDEWDHVGYIGAGTAQTSGSGSAWNGANGPVALYEYTFGTTTVYASLADGNYGSSTGAARAKAESYGVGVKHVFGDFTVAAGYESTTTDSAARTNRAKVEELSIGATATFGDFYVKAIYQDGSRDEAGVANDYDFNTAALGVEYTMGEAKLIGYYTVTDEESAVSGAWKDKYEAFGIGASYNLGGGASVLGGISRAKGKETAGGVTDTYENTRAQIGLNFTF